MNTTTLYNIAEDMLMLAADKELIEALSLVQPPSDKQSPSSLVNPSSNELQQQIKAENGRCYANDQDN